MTTCCTHNLLSAYGLNEPVTKTVEISILSVSLTTCQWSLSHDHHSNGTIAAGMCGQ